MGETDTKLPSLRHINREKGKKHKELGRGLERKGGRDGGWMEGREHSRW